MDPPTPPDRGTQGTEERKLIDKNFPSYGLRAGKHKTLEGAIFTIRCDIPSENSNVEIWNLQSSVGIHEQGHVEETTFDIQILATKQNVDQVCTLKRDE